MLIRNVRSDEVKTMWSMVEEESFGLNEDIFIDMFKIAQTFICFEDIHIGFAMARHIEMDDYETVIYISPDYRRQGYGRILMDALEERLGSYNELVIDNMLKYYDASEFLKNIGYTMWYSSSLMEYAGDKFDIEPLETVAYKDEYYEKMSDLRGEAFYQVRKDNDIHPFMIEPSEEERVIVMKKRDSYHLNFDGENLVGSLKISNGFIDVLMVHRDYRGQGYGKKLLMKGTNMILDDGYDVASLYVMDTNSEARKLYESFGYKRTSTVHVYRKKGK